MSKLQSKKGLNINDEGSSSSTFKPDATSESKGKEFFFQMEPTNRGDKETSRSWDWKNKAAEYHHENESEWPT